jgi:protein-disulfide isomerase
VLNAVKPSRLLLIVLSMALVCLAQTSAQQAAQTPASPVAPILDPGEKLPPDLARRVEVMIRSRSEVPSEYVISISGRTKSEVPGYDQINVIFSNKTNKSRPITFLLSTDNKTLAQFNKYDLSLDPKDKVPAAGRPSRGGPENAPVTIVVFDDLECPFCAQMHAAMFPAIVDRYKDQVHIVYLDFPLSEIHPWALRAAVDANCLAVASPIAYWNYADYVHAHASDFGGEEHTVVKANSELDKFAEDQGAHMRVNSADLEACIKKQDDTVIKAAIKEGETLGVDATPTLYINGQKITDVDWRRNPMELIDRIVDDALRAAGQTPPPPLPSAATPAAAPTATPVATPPANPRN